MARKLKCFLGVLTFNCILVYLIMVGNLTFGTYNCRGHSTSRISYIKHLMHSCDFLFIQEHWYYEANLSMLSKEIGRVNVFGVSGMDEMKLQLGRPYGGCAIVYKTSLECTVQPINTASKRLCAGIVKLPSGISLLLMNVYMPCDSYGNANALSDYRHVLAEVQLLLLTHKDVKYVVLGGDFNTDISRARSQHSELLTDFCNEEGLSMCVEKELSSIDYTFSSGTSDCVSVLDHFIVSDEMNCYVKAYTCLHDGDNFSDHEPVMLVCDFPVLYNCGLETIKASLPSWQGALNRDLLRYKEVLKRLLDDIALPLDAITCCSNDCSVHYDVINQYYADILYACTVATNSCIPSKGNHGSKAKVGWNEHVAPYKERCIFWYKIWSDCGKPRSGCVCDIYQKARIEYKRISRWVIRNQDKLSSERLSESLLHNDGRKMWSEVSRRTVKHKANPNTVDKAVGPSEICDLFMSKYCNLYNSVSYDMSDMDKLRLEVNLKCEMTCCKGTCYDSHVVMPGDVKEAVGKLKTNKADADVNISSNTFINGCDDLYVHIANLFNLMLSHAVTPESMLRSVLIPIPKSKKKSLNDSSNYRSIALSSILCKIFDNIVLSKHYDVLQTNELQFGFKKKHSTTQCTFIINEVVEYFTSRGSACYLVMLDATKAFDRVNYTKLFKLLLQRDMCAYAVRLLLNMYINQTLAVRWLSNISDTFNCSNGVKQGGVLSPVLFCIYI